MKIYISKQRGNIFIFSYYDLDEFFAHRIEIPANIDVNDNDLLRLALFSNPFESNTIEILGIKVNQQLLDEFVKILGKTISCDSYTQEDEFSPLQHIANEEIFLGFSGGFDSMAVKAILPRSTNVSIDFGGAFSREANFFRQLDTNIVNWDVRNVRLNSLAKFNEGKNWRFMLSPVTLFRGNRKNIAIATGTIMESSPYWLRTDNKNEVKNYSHFGYGMGVSLFNPAAGLTEITTTLIVNKAYSEDVVQNSLTSLAAPNTFKFHRKKTLLALANNEVYIPEVKYKFGSAITDDFLTLYFCWKFGKNWVKEHYSLNLPDDVPDIDMSFVEKVNVKNMLHIDSEFRNILLENINNFGIKQFNDDDYANLNLLNQYLLK